MNQYVIALVKTERLATESFLHTYTCPEIARTSRAGQFVSILPSASSDPLLRRPFSICIVDREEGTFTVLIKVVGPGTKLLADLVAGSRVDMLATLGLHFVWEGAKKLLLVAGGVGVAPLLLLAQEVHEQFPDSEHGRDGATRSEIVFCYGAQTGSQFVLLDRIEPLADRLVLTTNDGSKGIQGFCTEAAESHFDEDVSIFTCGPNPMMNDLLKRTRARGLEGQCSLENQMGCTIGACLGCVVPTTKGYRRICIDGPVLPTEILEEINW